MLKVVKPLSPFGLGFVLETVIGEEPLVVFESDRRSLTALQWVEASQGNVRYIQTHHHFISETIASSESWCTVNLGPSTSGPQTQIPRGLDTVHSPSKPKNSPSAHLRSSLSRVCNTSRGRMFFSFVYSTARSMSFMMYPANPHGRLSFPRHYLLRPFRRTCAPHLSGRSRK